MAKLVLLLVLVCLQTGFSARPFKRDSGRDKNYVQPLHGEENDINDSSDETESEIKLLLEILLNGYDVVSEEYDTSDESENFFRALEVLYPHECKMLMKAIEDDYKEYQSIFPNSDKNSDGDFVHWLLRKRITGASKKVISKRFSSV